MEEISLQEAWGKIRRKAIRGQTLGGGLETYGTLYVLEFWRPRENERLQ